MIEQERLMARVRRLAEEDARVVAALQYGSFGQRQGDEHSDVEFFLFLQDDALVAVDRRAWLEGVAPVELCYENEYGVTTAIFASLVRGEFHFEPARAIARVATWRTTWFADLTAAVLYDRDGRLTDAVGPLLGDRPRLDEPAQAAFLVSSLLNWTLMGANILARGDHARAHGFLGYIQTYVLQAARLVAGTTQGWAEPRRRLAAELPAAHTRYGACTVPLDAARLATAYAESWRWSRELIDQLAERHRLDVPAGVVDRIGERLERRAG
jgi:lincosamide nucleotidyltransferase B/F